jgi:ribonuclease HII
MNLRQEKKFWQKGFKIVVGVDEVGRGALAGPLTAAAVAILPFGKNFLDFSLGPLRKIKESKQLKPRQREFFYQLLLEHQEIFWAVASVSNKIIDQINILAATKLAMKKAVKSLEKKIQKINNNPALKIDFLILDGVSRIELSVAQKALIKADQKVFSCAAASIIAKITRDRLMKKWHKKYPVYRFDLHKGYATFLHCQAIRKFGFCPIHRKSFQVPLFNKRK